MSLASDPARPPGGQPGAAASAASGPSLAARLLAWWDEHGRRNLPWQKEPTPYRVWVSEVMLQQTQVATVERYYGPFITAFPTVGALAAAAEDEVLHAWSGLGYYGRARNLHRAARIVRDEHGGEVPTTFEALAALPGIGRSTAGAILALSLGRRHAILDGNVKRVLARVHRIEEAPDRPAVLRELWRLAEAHTPAGRVAHYTQAIMDLGATLCTRRRPACAACPLAAICEAHRAGIAAELPRPRPRRARPQRATVLMILRAPARAVAPVGRPGARADEPGSGPTGQDAAWCVLLEKRPNDGVWGGLWGLPEVAAVDEVAPWCAQAFGRTPARLAVHPVLRHGFTHFDLDITPVEVEIEPPARALEDGRWLWYNVREPARVGLAAPVTKLLKALR